MSRSIFLTLVRSPEEKTGARILIDSLRTFGGALRECPIWIFEANPHNAPCQDLANEQARVIALEMPASLGDYFFADKVFACAQAEALASVETQALVWMDPTVLCVQPPTLFDLGTRIDAAFRPVHIRNVGALATEPLDDFWRGIITSVGVDDIALTVESFVDAQCLRAYFNTHAFAINPHCKLLMRWRDSFATLVRDTAFQARACNDTRHQVFLHQALLSALVAATLDPARIRILPPTYNYPYNLHARVPSERRARALNDLVCLTYEDRSLDPGAMTDIQVNVSLATWLARYAVEP